MPSTAQAMTLTIPSASAEEQLELVELEKWCKDELVSLPSVPWSDLPASDGSIAPLTQPELQELAEHVDAGHVPKSNLCRGCLEAEGPRRIHRTVRNIDKATHTLHIDIAVLLSSLMTVLPTSWLVLSAAGFSFTYRRSYSHRQDLHRSMR